MRNYFKSGSWNITCDRCSKKTKADEIKKEWTGFLVCPVCFEHRQPQDFVKARVDKITVPFQRPRPPDVFINSCSAWGINSVADVGGADCAVVGFDNGLRPQVIGDK